MTAHKTWKQRFDEQPTTRWAAIVAVVTFLGTASGQRMLDRFAPKTADKLASIDTRLTLIERDLDGLARAMWRAGIVATNRTEATR